MQRKAIAAALILLTMTSTCASADHGCIEGRPYGRVIEVRQQLPRKWFFVGRKALSDRTLYSELNERYPDPNTSHRDASRFICLYVQGAYITVAYDASASWLDFSSVAPECWKCRVVNGNASELVSHSGLRIGQSRVEASTLLGVQLNRDHKAFTIRFHQVETGKNSKVWHEQSLTVEFQEDRLMRFHIIEHREPA